MLTAGPKVAIVLAIYNPDIDFLKKQLNSIKTQTYQDWVCYITDDNSDNFWYEKVKDILDHRFVITFWEVRVGAYANFERALKNLKSEEIIFFCDQDDIWRDEKIEFFLNTFEEDENVLLVHSDAELIDRADEVFCESLHKLEKTRTRELNPLGLILKNSITGCTMAVKTIVAETAIPFPATGGIQHDLWIATVASHLGKIAYLPHPLVGYRQHSANTIGASAPRFFNSFINPRNAAVGFLIKNELLKSSAERLKISRRMPLWKILMSSNFGLNQKLYAVNFKYGQLIVATHDFPTKIKILIFRIFAKKDVLSNTFGAIKLHQLEVSKKLMRIFSFGVRLIAKKTFREKILFGVKQIESADFHSGMRILSTPNGYLPQTQAIGFTNTSRPRASIIMFLPTLKPDKIFGGVSTALKIALELSANHDIRICVTDEDSFPINDTFHEEIATLLQVKKIEVKKILQNVEFKIVSVSSNDVFFTTAWWTMTKARQVARSFPSMKIKIFYLVQDFEPIFYSSSDLYVAALQTYREADFLIVNSRSLCKYLEESLSITLESALVLAPQYITSDLPIRSLDKTKVGPIRILIYGRPSTERNLFLTLIASLEFALKLLPNSACEIISVGEKHKNIVLNSGHVINSLGKLRVDEYLDLLRNSDLGVSLMMSPHPSYPPLEMVSAGMQVITNDYFGFKKSLKLCFNNLHVVEPSVPELARKIVELLSTDSQAEQISDFQMGNHLKYLGNPLVDVASAISKIVKDFHVS